MEILRQKMDERAKLGARIEQLANNNDSESKANFDEAIKDYDNITREIEGLKRVDATKDDAIIDALKPEVKDDATIQREAFNSYLKTGQIERALLKSGAGAVAPTPLVSDVMQEAKHYASLLQLGATIVEPTGIESYSYPIVDPTGEGNARTENETIPANTSITMSNAPISHTKYSSDAIRLTDELLSGVVDVWGLAESAANEIIFRKFSNDETANLVTDATNKGDTSASGSFTYADIVSLLHSVDPAYRASESFKFMLSDNALELIRNTASTDKEPLYDWLNDKILGKSYVINNALPTVTASAVAPIMAGDFSKLVVSASKYTTVKRIEVAEGYDLIVNKWLDAKLGVSGAVKYLTVAS